jgi:tRNA nucleotidyltransferase/poly(A) polymerase
VELLKELALDVAIFFNCNETQTDSKILEKKSKTTPVRIWSELSSILLSQLTSLGISEATAYEFYQLIGEREEALQPLAYPKLALFTVMLLKESWKENLKSHIFMLYGCHSSFRRKTSL